MTDLLPCPFCGCTTIKRVVQCAEIYWHECDWCSASGPVEGRDMNDEPQGWNTRAPTVSDTGADSGPGSIPPQPGEAPVSDAPAFGAWIDGAPGRPWSEEWFIAVTTYGDRVVLRALPDDWTYDFATADETYIKADRIAHWMPFPAPPVDSSAAPSTPVDNKISADPVGKEG